MKPGEWSEPGKESYFWCYKCQKQCLTFKARYYKGYHASGSEDQTDYSCPTCEASLEIIEIGDRIY